MHDGFSFDSSITCSEWFRVSWVNLGCIAGDRRQNLKTKFAHAHEQSEFTDSAYLVAAGHVKGKIASGGYRYRERSFKGALCA